MVFNENIHVRKFFSDFFFQYGFLDASRQADGNREITEFPREID